MTAAELLDAAVAGNRRALGRLLTIAERGREKAEELDSVLRKHRKHAHVIGITGAPGTGKSTLTGRLLDAMSSQGRRTAVLAVDPSSPRSGGAILGDRIRMDHTDDPHAFVRSLASRGSHGGLAASVPPMIRVFEAVGYDTVIIETVGVGQVELDIAALADTTVVVVTPGWGDAIQANKAGILEVADVFVVNKSDRPGAANAVRDLEYMLDLSPAGAMWRPPVIRTVATVGTGVDQLLQTLEDHTTNGRSTNADFVHRRVAAEVRTRVERVISLITENAIAARPDVVMAVAHGDVSLAIAADQLLEEIGTRLADSSPRSG